MKKIFPIIIILITLSLIGIITIQISWLRNMVLLREDQVKQKIKDVTKMVSDSLSYYKGSYIAPANKAFPNFSDEFSFELSKPYSVGHRFTAQELYEKIRLAFASQDMEKVPFQFGLASVNNGTIGYMERQSENFQTWYEDTVHHFTNYCPLITPSGTAAENLAIDEILIVVVPDVKNIVYQSLTPRFAIAILFTLMIVSAFFLTVRTMLRQKKMSEIKNDFINNMTHEFKTPIATISLAVDALKNEKVISDPTKLSFFSGIIKEENQRMNRQVETILKSALMDRQEVQLLLKPIHVHQIISDVADNFVLRLQEKQGAVKTELLAEKDLIDADEVHISNLINNLLDNAVKYSKETVPPNICITTSSNAKKLTIKIQDNGIGMSRETVKRIFEKFYRAHTGNVHNVKGFGLGLSYVEDIVQAHGGTIKAESTLGKGSCFTMEFPLKRES